MSTTQSHTDATRDAIHAAARRLFTRKGVSATTLAEIASEAHLSLDTLSQYYPTRDDLLHAIIALWAAQATPEAAPAAPVPAPLVPLPDLLSETDDAAGKRDTSPATPTSPAQKDAHHIAQNQTLSGDMSRLTVLNSPPHTRRTGAPLAEIFSSAIRSLGANRMRSMLTMLGIIIGVGAVIGLIAIGNGVQGQITGQITSNGANLVTIQGSSASLNGVQTGQRYQSITLEDAQALDQPGAVPDAVAVSPELTRQGQVTAGANNAYVTVNGVWPTYLQVHNSAVQTGNFISDTDVSGNTNVVVLGPSLARQLFGTDDPVGKSVQITGKSFRVVGVMVSKSAGFLSPDSQAYVPITSALATLNGTDQPLNTIKRGRAIGTINIAATSQGSVNTVVSEATDIMNQRHGVGNGQAPDFEMTTQTQLLQTVQTTIGLLQIFLVAIAGISLLVGGIGIMNIMLVSVTERTREIGIRKAIGAKEGAILTQFVMEAVLISFLGAIVGVIFGSLIAVIASALWRPCPVDATSIIVAVLFAMATGLFFGAYPARRAAALKPIDALRYE